MTNNELPEQWPKLKKELLKENPDLTEKELLEELMKDSEILLNVRKKLGKTNKEIRDWLSLLG